MFTEQLQGTSPCVSPRGATKLERSGACSGSTHSPACMRVESCVQGRCLGKVLWELNAIHPDHSVTAKSQRDRWDFVSKLAS